MSQETEERLARLRELRRRRQQGGYEPASKATFQRRGVPAPPTPQPSFGEIITHWWRNGPFTRRLPTSAPRESQTGHSKTTAKLPPASIPPSLWEQRARAWITQSRKYIAWLRGQAQALLLQARQQLNQRAKSNLRSGETEEVVPGLIVVGFAPDVARQEAVQQIGALGGKPLRHKAASNTYQVAVPPGQEQALIQQFRQRPGVLFTDFERLPARR